MTILNKQQEKEIISFLKSNYALPKYGFIAGQAVASLIYRQLGLEINSPINDIDIFQVQKKKDTQETYAEMRTHSKDVTIYEKYGSASNMFYSVGRRSYKVKKSYYLGENELINMILIEQSQERYLLDKEMLLESFDFNCCSVGFDIKSEEFTMTQSFIDFIKTKQLRVQSVHTPFHTVLRLNKKIQDLGENVYCDLPLERDILLTSKIMFSKPTIVGERFFNLYNNYKDDFIEKTFSFSDREQSYYEDRFKVEKQYKQVSVSENYVSNTKLKEFVEYNSFNSELDINGFNQVMVNFKTYVHLFHVFHDTGLFTNKYSKSLKEKVYDVVKNEHKGKNGYLKESLLLAILSQRLDKNGLNRISLDLKEKRMGKVLKALDENPTLINRVIHSYQKENIEDFIDSIYEIAKKAKRDKRYNLFYGLIETRVYQPSKIRKLLNKPFEEIKSELIGSFEAKRKIEKIKDIKIGETLSIKQLSTFDDFYETGKRMNNCVLGHYPNYMLNENQYYLLINYKGKESLIYFDDKTLNEHYGKNNSEISNEQFWLGAFVGYCYSGCKKLSFLEKHAGRVPHLLSNIMIYGVKRGFELKYEYLKYIINGKKDKFLVKHGFKKKVPEPVIDFDDDIPF
jgi:ribosomal protein S10